MRSNNLKKKKPGKGVHESKQRGYTDSSEASRVQGLVLTCSRSAASSQGGSAPRGLSGSGVSEASHCLCGFPVPDAYTRRHTAFNGLKLHWLCSPPKRLSAPNKRGIVLRQRGSGMEDQRCSEVFRGVRRLLKNTIQAMLRFQ
ncbi:hypothetical protein NQZ68_007110 [Dissostichus eleginoides]|nr:hypothetical protein NQZ68_007110 [Dissostichus eleginoides]